jgi:hypothetical protein
MILDYINQAVATATVSLLAGVLTAYISRRIKKQSDQEASKVEQIAQAVKSEEDASNRVALGG